jgi:polyhydroxyalkanoate synthase
MPDMITEVGPLGRTDAEPPELPQSGPEDFDRILHAWQSRFTGGRSPSTVPMAFKDWAAHAANAPFTMAALGHSAVKQWQRLSIAMLSGADAVTPKPDDHRFTDAAWQKRPYNMLVQSVLLGEEWWDKVVHAQSPVSGRRTPRSSLLRCGNFWI